MILRFGYPLPARALRSCRSVRYSRHPQLSEALSQRVRRVPGPFDPKPCDQAADTWQQTSRTLSSPPSQNSVASQPAEGDSEMAEFAAVLVEPLDEAECRQLDLGGAASAGSGIRAGMGLPCCRLNFALSEQAVVFRTGQDSPLGEDLRTGIADADYVVAFEVDEISPATREGWSILIQGSAHHVDSEHERAQVMRSGRRGLARRGERPVHPHPAHPYHRPAYPQAPFIEFVIPRFPQHPRRHAATADPVHSDLLP